MWILFFALWIAAALSIVIWSIRNGISPMPTSPKVKQALLQEIPSHLNGTILELGSGWGTLAFPLARLYPECSVIAYETSPIPYWWSSLRHALDSLPNLKILRQNFFTASFADAQLIVCYLYPAAMCRLKSKMEAELPPGTYVVSHTFAVPGWTPDRIVSVNDLYKTKIYIYRI